MPDNGLNIKEAIQRLDELMDRFSILIHGFDYGAEAVDAAEMWGKLKDKHERLFNLERAIEAQKDSLTQDIDSSIKEIVKERLDRDIVDVKNQLKTVPTLIKKAEAKYSELKALVEKPPKKPEEQKVVEAKKVEPKVSAKEVKDEKVAAEKIKKAEPRAKKIEVAKEKAVESIRSHYDDMGKVSSDMFINQIESIFDIKAGQIEAGKDFIKQLNKLTVDVLDLLQKEPKFTGPVSNFIKRLYPISGAITEFQKSVNDIKVPGLSVEKKIVIDETIDKMLDNGLNQKFVQPLRDLVYRNVTGGLSLSEAKAQIKEYIQGGNDTTGKLGQYLEQTAIQSVDMYSGIINKKLQEEFDYDGLLMTGSLIDNSSPQCRFAIEKLNGKITKENWSQVEAIGKKQSGWIDGTTFDNVALNKLHWGCRHNFFPIMIKKAS
jgi:hypothetical protein